MNSIIISKALLSQPEDTSDSENTDNTNQPNCDDSGKCVNRGKMIIDATVAEQKIAYQSQ